MKKVLKWIGIILGSLIILIIIAASILVVKANKSMKQTMDVTPENIIIPTDSASIARGEHFAFMCAHCHGPDLEGMKWFDDPSMGVMWTPNLTPGKGSATVSYTDADWVRSLRHGVNPQKKVLFVMPSTEIGKMSERDISCVIAYLKTLPPVDNEIGETEFTMLAKIFLGAGMFGDVFPAKVIDHDAPFVVAPPEGPTEEYGGYLMGFLGCGGCHGKDLAGGKTGEPGAPLVINISPGGEMGKWTVEEFTLTIRTGQTPAGKKLDKKYMPWDAYLNMTDEELTAVYNYLQAQPAAVQNEGKVNI